MAFVRSTIAHATIEGDRHERRRARCRASSRSTPPTNLELPDHHGFMMLPPTMNRPPLARDRVRFVGDIVAMVVAETEGAGGRRRRSGDRRLRPAAGRRRHGSRDRPPTRRSCSRRRDRTSPTRMGTGPIEGVLDDADVVVTSRIVNQRVAPVPMEPARDRRGSGRAGRRLHVLGRDAGSARRARRARGQARPRSRRSSAAPTPAVGGGFGAKAGRDRRVPARRQGRARCSSRPVKWAETRCENMVAMWHGRGHDPLRRDGPEARRHDHRTARADDRRRGRVPGGRRVPAVLHADDVAERVRRSRRSSSTGRPRSPTPRRSPRTAARAGPRRSTSSSASSTWRPTSSTSTRSRSGARTSSRPRRSRSRTVTGLGATYDSGEYAKALDVARRERRLRRAARRAGRTPRARRHEAARHRRRVVPRDQRAAHVQPRVRRGRDRRRRNGHRAGRHERARPGPRDDVRA